MGYYVNENMPAKGKMEALIEQHNAEEVSVERARGAVIEGLGVVCVVDNGFFEAAGFAYDLNEFEEFAESVMDKRPKRYCIMDRSLLCELTGYNDVTCQTREGGHE